MLRTIIAYLLIAVVLICPYLCLGEEGAWTVAHSSAAGCACCGEPAQSNGEAPESPDEGEPDCLCHGAIMDGSRVECPEARADEMLILALDLNDDTLASSLLSALGSPLPSHFPPLSTGREICAICCALLL